MRNVKLYTDGACEGNPGPGGYGAVLLYNGNRKELSGFEQHTTNNRMELMGAIVGLKALKEPCKVDIYSDSRYLVDSVNLGRAKRWKENGWKRNKREQALNIDLWEIILGLLEIHTVVCHWVKGHSGDVENECCDALAQAAIKRLSA